MHALALFTIKFHHISVTLLFRLVQLLLADALNLSVPTISFIKVVPPSVSALLVKVLCIVTPKAPLSAFLQAENFQSQQYPLPSIG